MNWSQRRQMKWLSWNLEDQLEVGDLGQRKGIAKLNVTKKVLKNNVQFHHPTLNIVIFRLLFLKEIMTDLKSYLSPLLSILGSTPSSLALVSLSQYVFIYPSRSFSIHTYIFHNQYKLSFYIFSNLHVTSHLLAC